MSLLGTAKRQPFGHDIGRPLGLGCGRENFDQARGDELVLAGLELPNSKAEGIGVGLAAMLVCMILARGGIGIAPAHAADVGTHAADAERTGVGELLHDLLTGDVELGAIDLPAVMRRDVAKRLGIELARQSGDAELSDRVGNDLGASVVRLQSLFVVLVHENFQGFQKAEDGFFADFAAAANAVFLRAHVHKSVADQLFPAYEEPRSLRAANVLATAEGHHVKTHRRIFPEALDGRNVGGGIIEGEKVVGFGNFDGFRASDFSFVGQDVGEMDGEGFRIDGADHLLAGFNFDELGAGLADLMVKGIAVGLLDDDFVLWEVADIRNSAHERLEVFGHHAGVADDHGRSGATGDEAGVARGRICRVWQ